MQNIVWWSNTVGILIGSLFWGVIMYFFGKRVYRLRKWGDIYLLLTYMWCGLSLLTMLLLDNVRPFFPGIEESLQVLISEFMMKLFLVSTIGMLIPLVAFNKFAFHREEEQLYTRLADTAAMVLIFINTFGLVYLYYFVDLTTMWDQQGWYHTFEYQNFLIMLVFFLPYLFSIGWFIGGGLRRYLFERRKEHPNPPNLRRFLLLTSAGVSHVVLTALTVILNLISSFFVGFELELIIALRALDATAIVVVFMVLSYLGWIMPQRLVKA
ncbi:MAG: hypothetical protein ACFFC7_12105 [Candidatus Hermodarchaeota archaeon]